MLNSEILGTWELVEWRHLLKDNTVSHPFGTDAKGLLVYSPEGYMTGAMMKQTRKPFEKPGLLAGLDSEKAEAYAGYLHYAGRFSLEGNEVIHHVELSLFPNWVGTEQRRFFKIEKEILTLSAPKVEVVWKRIRR